MAAFRFTTAGESHGPGLVAIVEGLPAGLELDRERIDREMARRQLGHGRGGRMKIERDSVEIRSGVRHGRTLGSPVAVLVANRDYANWEERMNPWPVDAEVEEVAPAAPRPRRPRRGAQVRALATSATCSSAPAPARPRPGWPPARSRRSSCGVRRQRAQPRAADRLGGGAPSATISPPTDFADVDDSPVRCLDAGRGRGDGRRDRPAAEGEREPRRRSSRCAPSASCPGSAPTSPGTSAWTAASPRRVVSIQAVKGVSVGEAWEVAGVAGLASPTTRSSGPRSAAGTARPTAPAASRAGCRTASRSSCAAALKPISTLTKPLRSVDTETKEPAQALRERTDSTVVPAAGVVGEAMVALVLARCYREKFGGDHIDDALAALAGVPGADRVAALERRRQARPAGARLHRLHGRRQVARGPHARATPASRRSTPTSCSRASSGCSIAEFFGRRGRGGVPSPRGGARWAGLLERRRRRRDRARRRQRALRAASARRSAATSSSGCRSTPRRPGGGSRASGRWPATATASRRCSPSGCRIYEALADAILPGDAEIGAPRAAGAARPARAPRGTRLAWAASASGEYPAFVGRGLLRRATGRSRASRFCVTDTDVAAAARRADRPLAARRVEVEPGERAKTLAGGRAGAARAGAARRRLAPTTWWRSAAAWSATSPASARRPTSAGSTSSRCRPRWSPRSTPPTAARRASTCPRRRTTSAPTTCRRPCSPTRRRSRPCRRGARGGLRRGAEDGADRRAARCGSGSGDRASSTPASSTSVIFACARTKLEVVAADERDAGAAPGAQPRPHGRPRDRGGDRLSALPPRRGGRARAPGGAAALERRRASRRGRGAARAPRPADRALRRGRSDAVLAALERDKKRTSAGLGFVLLERPGEPRPGQSIDPGRVRAAVSELVAR